MLDAYGKPPLEYPKFPESRTPPHSHVPPPPLANCACCDRSPSLTEVVLHLSSTWTCPTCYGYQPGRRLDELPDWMRKALTKANSVRNAPEPLLN